MREHGLTRRQRRRRERLERVLGWRREIVECTREEQINAAWHQHREFLRANDQGNCVAGNPVGMTGGNKQNDKRHA